MTEMAYALPITLPSGKVAEFYHMPEGGAQVYVWDNERRDGASCFVTGNRAESWTLLMYLRGAS